MCRESVILPFHALPDMALRVNTHVPCLIYSLDYLLLMPIFGVRTDLIIPQLFVVSFKYVEQQRGNGSWKSTEVYCMLKSMCHIETVYKKKTQNWRPISLLSVDYKIASSCKAYRKKHMNN